MLLFWSPRSPYARRVMIAAHELGLGWDIKLQLSVNSPGHVDPELVGLSPIGKIPVLRMPDGEMIFDSYFIIERLNLVAASRNLFGGPEKRAATIACHTVGDGMLDAAFRRVAETWRPGDGMTEIIQSMQNDKIIRCLAWCERRSLQAKAPLLGEISVATALSYMDFRCPDLEWRREHPRLASWYEAMAQRSSMTNTEFESAPPSKVATARGAS